jgi:hypothetical protein
MRIAAADLQCREMDEGERLIFRSIRGVTGFGMSTTCPFLRFVEVGAIVWLLSNSQPARTSASLHGAFKPLATTPSWKLPKK